jgi:hypothetical protein
MEPRGALFYVLRDLGRRSLAGPSIIPAMRSAIGTGSSHTLDVCRHARSKSLGPHAASLAVLITASLGAHC